MTKEEKAVYEFENILGELGSTVEVTEDLRDACRTVIETLQQQPCEDKYLKEIDHLRKYISKLETQIVEQKPCEDAISRTEVKRIVDFYKEQIDGIYRINESVDNLPPVTPQQKTGHWIKSQDSYGNYHFTCPFCEHDIATKADVWEDNYCSNCGAKLKEVEDDKDN